MGFILAGFFVTSLYLLTYLLVFRSVGRSLKEPWQPLAAGAGNPDLPTVSIIVAVRNEALNLPGLLLDLNRQQYPESRVEFIIADDHSEDESAEIVTDFLHAHRDMRLRFIVAEANDPPGKKAALDRAFRQSTGDIILTTDGDTVLNPGWVLSMVDRFSDENVKMVLGPVFFIPCGNLLQKLLATEFLGVMGATCGFAGMKYPVMCNGANLAFRREVFNETGGYQANIRFTSGDDQFLMMAVRERYGKHSVVFMTSPTAIVTTEAPATIGALFSQRLRWLSKSRGYRAIWVVAAGLITGLPFMAIFVITVAGLIVGNLSLILIAQLWMLIKMAIDLLLVMRMAGFAGVRLNLWHFLLAQYLQLVYAPITGMASLFFRSKWKGRRIV